MIHNRSFFSPIKRLTIVLIILIILPNGLVFADQLEITDLDLWQRTNTSDWVAVQGNYADGFTMPLDPAVTYYYLDTHNITSNRPIIHGEYEFFITAHPDGFFTYWESRGVYEGCTGTWEPIMWEIINGRQPMFYLRVDDAGTMLIDGLQKLAGLGDHPLRLNGDYHLGAYTFSGTVEDENVAVAVEFVASLPDLVVLKTNNTSDNTLYIDETFTWNIQISNTGFADAHFSENDIILRDELPAGANYSNLEGPSPKINHLGCAIFQETNQVLICMAVNGDVALPPGQSFSVEVGVEPTATGTLINTALVDAGSVITEGDKDNNTSTDSVEVISYEPGTLSGTVFGLEACDINPSPLNGATVNVYDGEIIIQTMTTNPTGDYAFTLDHGVYDIEVIMAGYVSQTQKNVILGAGATLQTDFDLRLLAPCLSVSPTSINHQQNPGTTETQTLTLINTGAGQAEVEMNRVTDPYPITLLSEGFEQGLMPPAGGWATDHQGDTIWQWEIVDQQIYPDYVYNGRYAAWVNYDVNNSSNEWLMTPLIDITGITDLSITFWARSNTEKKEATMKVWVFDKDGNQLTTESVWHLIRDNNWDTRMYREVTIDLSQFAGLEQIQLRWQYVGINGQSFGLDNVMVTGYSQAPWYLTDPAQAIIPGDSTIDVDLTFDATGLKTGSYTARLDINSDSAATLQIPVSLEVSFIGEHHHYLPLFIN